MKKNIMIATPAMNGVTIPYCISFAYTVSMLLSQGIEVTPLVVPSSSLLVSERNRILEAFWQSKCTHILCIDSDLGWPPQAILAMLEQEKDFICGVYPTRSNEINAFTYRPTLDENSQLIQEKHLIKMDYIPAGFMLITRNMIKVMRDKYPELYYCPKDEKNDIEAAYCFFNTEVRDGEFWGEDYVFSRLAREAGFDIWCDPLIQFNHAGKIGMLRDCLLQNPQKPKQDNTVYIGAEC